MAELLAVSALDKGGIQLILFGVMMIGIFLVLFITIAK